MTIPAEIRHKWGLKKGDLVTFQETKRGIPISPREKLLMKTLEEIGEALKERAITLRGTNTGRTGDSKGPAAGTLRDRDS